MSDFRVLIIGGGASGLAAAIASARLGASVTLLEGHSRVGRKILASGNGRCNLTNLSVSPQAYNSPAFVEPVLDTYPAEGIRSFFGTMGLLTFADDEGRVYPTTNVASSVLDVLRLECAHLGIDVRCESKVEHIADETDAGGFEVSCQDDERFRAHTVVVATGGGGSLLATLGNQMVEQVPVLGPLRTNAEPIRGLSGVRVRCAAALLVDVDGDNGGRVVARERGELLFRDYGVSGIMVFALSRHIEKGCVISIDLFPDFSSQQLQVMLAQRGEALGWRTAETFFAGMLHDRVARALMRAAGIAPETPADGLPHVRLATLLKDFRLDVLGVADANQAQVTRGGAAVDGFHPDTLESRYVSGLFAAGEVLDIDGQSGGYNLHWAWASGIVAGEAAARLAVVRAGEGDTGSRGSA